MGVVLSEGERAELAAAIADGEIVGTRDYAEAGVGVDR